MLEIFEHSKNEIKVIWNQNKPYHQRNVSSAASFFLE